MEVTPKSLKLNGDVFILPENASLFTNPITTLSGNTPFTTFGSDKSFRPEPLVKNFFLIFLIGNLSECLCKV